MPSRNIVKRYSIGSYYHVYNRGVEKRDIFLDELDYDFLLRKLRLYDHLVNVNCFCLMPNHFHLLVQNNVERGIEKFSRSIFTSYSMYFNRKYGRVGYLFQGNYKARILTGDREVADVISYIKNNPLKVGPHQNSKEDLYEEDFTIDSKVGPPKI